LTALLVLSSSLGLACAVPAEPERLGFTEVQQTAPSATLPATTPSDFAGHWRGQAPDLLELSVNGEGEPPAFKFPSGSSDINLDIAFPQPQELDATLVFGSAAPPRATDPLASYPPGTTIADYDSHPAALEGAVYHLFQQFVLPEVAPEDREGNGNIQGTPSQYSLADADGILRLEYNTADLYADWCALQPSLPTPSKPRLFNCLGADGVDQASDGTCYTYNDPDADYYARVDPSGGQGIIPNARRQVDCARAFACFDQCSCDDPNGYANAGVAPPAGYTPCTSGSGSGTPHFGALWLRQSGAELVGAFTGEASFVNARGARTTLGLVHFQRVE
jgi:hypothetical protein